HHVLLYSNDQDGQEHLALVWGYGTELVRGRSDGPRLLSASLEAAHSADETLDDRVVRGCHIPSAPSQDALPAIAVNEADPVLVRIHSCCFTGETLGSLRCDCQEQLHAAMQQMAAAGRGVIVYLAQEGRGIGLHNKLRAYNLIDRRRLDTLDANLQLGLPADARSYSVAAAILRDLGVDRVALLTNNPEKIAALAADSRIAVQSRIAMTPASWEDKDHGSRIDDRDGYLIAKAKRMGHMIEVPNSVLDGVAAASSV
ncbi:GTP cyclohydrolase II, partial [Entophlyctis luteolus]